MGHQHRKAFAPLSSSALQRPAFSERHAETVAVAAILRLPQLWRNCLATAHRGVVAVAGTHCRSRLNRRKADIPRVPPAHKAQWIRIADPRRAEIHVRDESRHAIHWLESCFSHDRLRSLRQRPLLQCYAAADAVAQGNLVGVGGWIITSTTVAWFSEQYNMSEIRSVWPALLQDTAQRYIACFETLASSHSQC